LSLTNGVCPCCDAVDACGVAATSLEHFNYTPPYAHSCRDLAIPFTEIEGRPKLLWHFLFFDRIG
jgi:hypothetical protein